MEVTPTVTPTDTPTDTPLVRPITINIGRDFSRYPGGRFYTDGDFSGARFREEFLVPALQTGEEVVVELDGPLGFGSSFLEEAFGGAVRVHDLPCDNLLLAGSSGSCARLTSLIYEYIGDAKRARQLFVSRESGENENDLCERTAPLNLE